MKHTTEFGRFLAKYGLTHGVVADALGVTRAYVGMLASGKAKPIGHMQYAIEQWSKRISPREPVTMQSWYEDERGRSVRNAA